MSEFSECFYLRSNNVKEGISLLNAAGFKGVVFEPNNNWVTILPQAFLSEAIKPIVAANQGTLLHYIFAEDHGWGFSIYKKTDRVFHYNCRWETKLLIDDKGANKNILNEFIKDEASLAEFDAILHPKTLFDIGDVNHAFARLLGLTYYEWLSGDYLDSFDGDVPGIAYNDSIPRLQRERITGIIETMMPDWVRLQAQAECYLREQQYQEALDIVQQAIQIVEGIAEYNDSNREVFLVQLVMLRVRIYLAQKNYPNAVHTIDSALERFHSISTYEYLSWMLSEKIKISLLQEDKKWVVSETDIEQLLEYVTKSKHSEISRHYYYYMLELAKVYESKQRLSEAEYLYDNAVEMMYDEARVMSKKSRLYSPLYIIKSLEPIVKFYEHIQQMDKANFLRERIEEIQEKKWLRKKTKRKV